MIVWSRLWQRSRHHHHHHVCAIRMASTTRFSPPSEPMVVILGSTGTGKSELAVDLATRFNGEVVNADAMQLYKGLPIITNKITIPERRGVPHHLLDHISLDSAPWVVDDFKCAARAAVQDIRARGRLPVVVGGTHYYTNSLLFEDIFVGEGKGEAGAESGEDKKEEPSSAFPILDEPTDVILTKLREVDPVMAERWHPNDRRKISRSLEIWLKYGRPASDIYAEQKKRKCQQQQQQPEGGAAGGLGGGGESDGDGRTWQNLLFWVHSDPEALKQRLDKRVDKMLEAGLMDETRQMFEHVKHKEAYGEEIHFTRGIWQSIGFKEFQAYLRAVDRESAPNSNADFGPAPDPSTVEKLLATAIENVKTSTRQYAKYQTRWIKAKTVPLLREKQKQQQQQQQYHQSPPAPTSAPGPMDSLFVLDSTDVSRWTQTVSDPAADVTRRFLAGKPMPEPASLSVMAREVFEGVAAPPPAQTVCQNTCDVCGVTCVTAEQWEKHVRGKKHKTRLKGTRRRALVTVERRTEETQGQGQEKGLKEDEDGETNTRSPAISRASSPELDLGSMYVPPAG